jgi:lipopolysaccharide/colanic/teichoic acid biosynthesis glycosyltransferase
MPPYHQLNEKVELSQPEVPALSSLRYEVRQASTARKLVESSIAAVALLVLSPLLLTIALAVRLTSPGPAVFKQERIGKDGLPFRIWKFRTMVDGADNQLGDLLAQHDRDGEPLFKVPQDPRITPLGQFLRKTSLDELPQLVNVVRGEMAFIGPRPQRAEEVALYTDRERGRLSVPPGITGLWQVSGRSDLPWQEAVELDLRYVRERSHLLDLQILLKTFVVVFARRGAE